MMTANETAKYAMNESIRATACFGVNPSGLERAYVVGRKDQRAAGGRAAVLAAMRALGPADERVTEAGYVEFWGRRADLEPYRVVVI
jgi:hypothetical protein